MNKNKNGPEWGPIRNYVKTFKIIVTIFDDDDNVIRTERMDYGIAEDRAWLGRLSYWAWSNGHTVESREDK